MPWGHGCGSRRPAPFLAPHNPSRIPKPPCRPCRCSAAGHHRHSHSVGNSEGGDRDRGGVSSDQLDRELEAAKERLRRIQLEREALAKQVG